MLTERQKRLIETYIPSPKDPELDFGEYYVMDSAERIQKVEICNIFPHGEDTYYNVVQVNTRRHVKGWRDYEAFAMGDLYDNREDCKNGTHIGFNGWESLRELQQNEVQG